MLIRPQIPTSSCNNIISTQLEMILPSLIVFDLDDCLWTPEMHELSGLPTIPIEGPLDPNNIEMSPLGTIGMKVGRGRSGGGWGGYSSEEEIVELYPEARLVLRELATNPKYKDVQIAVASTSLEPSYSQACLDGIEILDGVTMRDMISYAQVGRTGQLTSRKTSHFQLIHEESKCKYEDMLFFDDCNWGDHVGDLFNKYGVIGIRTPEGLKWEDFHRGLEKYHSVKKK